jgi:hypothetical protein
VALGGILIIVGIVVALVQSLLIGLLLIVVGLLLGGFRRGRWY